MATPTALTQNQWQKVATAAAFAFLSTFVTVFIDLGGIQSSWDATISLIASAAVSGMNAGLYALYLVFKTDTTN